MSKNEQIQKILFFNQQTLHLFLQMKLDLLTIWKKNQIFNSTWENSKVSTLENFLKKENIWDFFFMFEIVLNSGLHSLSMHPTTTLHCTVYYFTMKSKRNETGINKNSLWGLTSFDRENWRQTLLLPAFEVFKTYTWGRIRGISILGEVRSVEISRVTQQLLCSKSRDSRWMSYETAAILNQNLPYIPHIIG